MAIARISSIVAALLIVAFATPIPVFAKMPASVSRAYPQLLQAISRVAEVRLESDKLGNQFIIHESSGMTWRAFLVPCSQGRNCLAVTFSSTLDGVIGDVAAANRLNMDMLYSRVTVRGSTSGEPSIQLDLYQGDFINNEQVAATTREWMSNLKIFHEAFRVETKK